MPFRPGFFGALRKLDIAFLDATHTTLSAGSTQQNWSWPNRNFGAASADRYLLLTTQSAANSVTIGGTSASMVANTGQQFWLVHMPSGSSGNIVAQSFVAQSTYSFGLYAITGPLNTTPFDTAIVNDNTVDVAIGGIVIANVSAQSSGIIQTATWSGLTEAFDLPRAVSSANFGHSGAMGEFPSAQSVTATASFPGPNTQQMVMASFSPL